MTALPDMNALVSEYQAARTVHLLFAHLDGRNYHDAACLFVPDGTWNRQGRTLVGPAEIEASLAARPATLATRHLVTNLIATAGNAGVDACYTITVFDDEHATGGPARLTLPGAIFAAEDRLIATPDGWRFSARTPVLVFRKAAHGN